MSQPAPSPNPDEVQILTLLAESFYAVVPDRLQTYCAVTSRIAAKALQAFGIACDLLPCQMWYTTPGRSYVVGFVDNDLADKWDGHVICAGRHWFLETSVRHFKTQFDIDVPRVISGQRFNLPSQAIARHDLTDTERIWWHHPPPGVDPTPPAQPQELIDHQAGQLVAFVKHALAQRTLAGPTRAGDAAHATA